MKNPIKTGNTCRFIITYDQMAFVDVSHNIPLQFLPRLGEDEDILEEEQVSLLASSLRLAGPSREGILAVQLAQFGHITLNLQKINSKLKKIIII